MNHPHELPQQGGSHVITPEGKLERREFTIQPGEEGHPETAEPAEHRQRKPRPAPTKE